MDYFLKRFERIYENFLFSQKIYGSDTSRCYDSFCDCLREYDRICAQHDYQDHFSMRLKSVAEDFKHKVRVAYVHHS